VDYTVTAGKTALPGKVANTQGDWVFKEFPLGEMRLEAGDHTLQVKAATKGVAAMNLEWVRLTPIP